MARKLVEDTETEDLIDQTDQETEGVDEEDKKQPVGKHGFDNEPARAYKKKMDKKTRLDDIHKTKHNEELEEDSPAASTLHPNPTRSEHINNVMHYLANISKEHLKWFEDMLKKHDRKAEQLGIPAGASAHNQGTLKTHPSNAVAKEALELDVDELLGESEGLTPEFKEKAKVLFEAAINAQVAIHQAALEDAYEQALNEELEEVANELEEKVAAYCEYIGEQWMKDNEVAIESALRNEIAQEVVDKVRDAISSFIDIPENQVDVVDTLANKVEELEGQLAEAITENADLRQFRIDTEKKKLIDDHADELKTTAEKEKFRKLAEGVETEDLEEFTSKVKVIKESMTTTPKKKSTVENLLEEVDESKQQEKQEGFVDPQMRKYLDVFERREEV